jgi:hypothetical protein
MAQAGLAGWPKADAVHSTNAQEMQDAASFMMLVPRNAADCRTGHSIMDAASSRAASCSPFSARAAVGMVGALAFLLDEVVQCALCALAGEAGIAERLA